MILIDTSAWIEFFNAPESRVAKKVDAALEHEFVVVGDLVYCEVMQGIKNKRQRNLVAALFGALHQVDLCGFEVAEAAAENFRILRAKGVTVRKTIDCIIATFCMGNGMALMHADKDFDAFEKHLDLKVV